MLNQEPADGAINTSFLFYNMIAFILFIVLPVKQ